MIGRLDIVVRVGIESHTFIEINTMLGSLVVCTFYFEYHLLFLLGEEIEKDSLAKPLVAEVFIDGEMLNVDEIVKCPIGEDAYWFVAVVVGGDHEMEFVFVTMLQLPERRSFFVGKSRLK